MKITMNVFLASILLLGSQSMGNAYVPSMTVGAGGGKKLAVTDRRRVIGTFGASLLGAAAAGAVGVAPSRALDACPPKSKNCVRTSWTPPSGSSKDAAISDLRAAVKAYPQEGQNEVDGGGWSIAEDALGGPAGVARVEYQSSGTGFFAKAFNGGKPFTDDLLLEVDGDGTVQVRSSSRIGESDFGVNQKRVDYLAATLRGKGWTT